MVAETAIAINDQPRSERHATTCGCLACAEWRAEMRRLGWLPVPARDWRGEELAS